MFRSLSILCASACLVACGGGSSDSAQSPATQPTQPTDQSPGGIWEATQTINGVRVKTLALVSENGKFYAASLNLDNNCASVSTGSITTSGHTFSGSAIAGLVLTSTDSGIQTNCTFPDGSKSGISSLSGTVDERTSLTLTSSLTTSNGTTLPSETGSLTFDPLYNETSSLSKLAGNWTGPTGVVSTVQSDGSFFAQDPASGCVVNGQYSIINPSYNVYAGSASYSNCQGAAAILNGQTASGLMTLDSTVSPNQLEGGVSVKLNDGTVIILVASATKS